MKLGNVPSDVLCVAKCGCLVRTSRLCINDVIRFVSMVKPCKRRRCVVHDHSDEPAWGYTFNMRMSDEVQYDPILDVLE